MKEASFDLARTVKHIKACTSISSLTFTYDETEMYEYGSDFFMVTLSYPNQYKEIKMIQAIDIQTVIGNAGGYIGLFLGNSIKVPLKLLNII